MVKKRILSILLCLIIAVPLISVTVSATGTGTNQAMYPVLPWRTVSKGTSYQNQTEFAGQFLRANQRDVTTNSPMMTQITSTSTASDAAVVEFYTGAGNRNLGLIARDFVLDMSKLTLLEIYATADELECRCDFTGQIGVMQLVGNYWRVVNYPITSSSRSGSLLSDLKAAISNVTTDKYVYVRNLEIMCSTSVDEADGVWVYTSSYTTQTINLQQFLGNQPMQYQKIVTVDPANPNDASLVDWLVVGVGGFLQFELWEGFTLNQLIEFVVVIGLVLWFITLLI